MLPSPRETAAPPGAAPGIPEPSGALRFDLPACRLSALAALVTTMSVLAAVFGGIGVTTLRSGLASRGGGIGADFFGGCLVLLVSAALASGVVRFLAARTSVIVSPGGVVIRDRLGPIRRTRRLARPDEIHVVREIVRSHGRVATDGPRAAIGHLAFRCGDRTHTAGVALPLEQLRPLAEGIAQAARRLDAGRPPIPVRERRSDDVEEPAEPPLESDATCRRREGRLHLVFPAQDKDAAPSMRIGTGMSVISGVIAVACVVLACVSWTAAGGGFSWSQRVDLAIALLGLALVAMVLVASGLIVRSAGAAAGVRTEFEASSEGLRISEHDGRNERRVVLPAADILWINACREHEADDMSADVLKVALRRPYAFGRRTVSEIRLLSSRTPLEQRFAARALREAMGVPRHTE